MAITVNFSFKHQMEVVYSDGALRNRHVGLTKAILKNPRGVSSFIFIYNHLGGLDIMKF